MARLVPLAHQAVSKDDTFQSFPSLVKRADGTFLLGFRQARDYAHKYGKTVHIDPRSTGIGMVSPDGWTWDQQQRFVIVDHYLYGVQDPCMTALQDGTIVCTYFMWNVVDRVEHPEGRDVYDKWTGFLDHTYVMRSHDGGVTWEEPTRLCKGALRGNCLQLPDGTILVAAYRLEQQQSGGLDIFRSTDNGASWSLLAHIANVDDIRMVEPNLYRTPSGKLICFARSTRGNEWPLMTIESLDDGRTWSRPQRRTIDTLNPYHLLRLHDGHVLLSYGHRRKPDYGIRAKLLDPECACIDEAEEIIIRADGGGPDLGYTSAVQLGDGRVVIAYYFNDDRHGPRYIAATLCAYESGSSQDGVE